MEFVPWLTGRLFLELRSELRSDALLVTTIDFFGIRTHNSLHAKWVFYPLSHGYTLHCKQI